MILDTYPDPRFFALRKEDATEWTPDLLRKIFGKKKNEEYFLVRTPGDGIIQVGSILCSKEECEIAISEYISEATWENIGAKIDHEIKEETIAYDINFAPISVATNKKDKPKSRLFDWGEYEVIVGRRNVDEKNPILLNIVAPKYKKNKAQLDEAQLYEFDSAQTYFLNYPFTVFNEFHYFYNKHMAYQKCFSFYNECNNTFWIQLIDKLVGKKWTRKTNVFPHELVLYHNDLSKPDVTYLFVMEPTVRNAKIVKSLT